MTDDASIAEADSTSEADGDDKSEAMRRADTANGESPEPADPEAAEPEPAD